jgi:hypothetical protein
MALRDKVVGQIGKAKNSRERNMVRIAAVLVEVGRHYEERRVAELDLHQDNDLHAFYRLTTDPSKVLHVQTYPGLSTDEIMVVRPRMMDYDRMMAIRAAEPGVSVGNEHEAVTATFCNGDAEEIPYSAQSLMDLIEVNVPELR